MSTHLLNVNNFTNEFEYFIDLYVKENITSELESKYKDFVPMITLRMEEICQDLFKKLQKGANDSKGKFNFTIDASDYYLHSDAVKLIIKIFQKKLDVVIQSCSTTNLSAGNSLNAEIFPGKYYSFKMPCFWSIKHPGFSSGNTSRRYTYHPEARSASLFDCAQKGIETDVAIMSESNEKIPVHALILKVNSAYFNAMLNASMKESANKVISLPYSTEAIKNLVQFIYQGRIDPSSHKEIVMLIELLEMSHAYGINDLFNHSTDLILQFLNENTDLVSQELVVNLVNCAYDYDLKEFLEFALRGGERACEKSEIERPSLTSNTLTSNCLAISSSTSSSSATSLQAVDSSEGSLKTDTSDQTFVIDWKEIPKKHYVDLLILTGKYSLPRMQEELTRLINQFLQ